MYAFGDQCHNTNYRPQPKFGTRLYFHRRVSRILITGGSTPRGVCSQEGLLQEGCLVWAVPAPGGACSGGVPGADPPPMATAAGGTHPTGMHY